VLALIGGMVSDALEGRFWSRHALLAGLVASVLAVMLSVALVNQALERRRRRNWSVLAQHVMLELVDNARLIWTGVLEPTQLVPAQPSVAASIDAGSAAVRDTPRLRAAIREMIADADRRRVLHEKITRLVRHGDELLGRWAAAMLNADAYAEVIDRHVELVRILRTLGSQLDHCEPAADPRLRQEARSSVAVQVEEQIDDDVLADKLVLITQLAEELDQATLQIALHIVPVQWWQARVGTAFPADLLALMARKA
jgi:hypothetical protein